MKIIAETKVVKDDILSGIEMFQKIHSEQQNKVKYIAIILVNVIAFIMIKQNDSERFRQILFQECTVKKKYILK